MSRGTLGVDLPYRIMDLNVIRGPRTGGGDYIDKCQLQEPLGSDIIRCGLSLMTSKVAL